MVVFTIYERVVCTAAMTGSHVRATVYQRRISYHFLTLLALMHQVRLTILMGHTHLHSHYEPCQRYRRQLSFQHQIIHE